MQRDYLRQLAGRRARSRSIKSWLVTLLVLAGLIVLGTFGLVLIAGEMGAFAENAGTTHFWSENQGSVALGVLALGIAALAARRLTRHLPVAVAALAGIAFTACSFLVFPQALIDLAGM